MERSEESKHQLQRELEQAWRNTAKMQNGEAPAPNQWGVPKENTPDPPKRVARALVSTAHKGSIPTTLGGKMPPVSVLSRREFGLRVLRK
jgi:hypothetical protein